MTIGRNDPCPCGSGKKYKKCCFDKDKPADTAKRFKEAENKLIKELVKFGHSRLMEQEQKKALDVFFAVARNAPRSFWSPEKEINFMGWFVFNYHTSSGQRVIEAFLERESYRLTSLEQEMLQKWISTWPCIYEVQDVEPGTGMLLENIFTGERTFVHDVSGSRQVKKWIILLAHVIPVGEIWRFASYIQPFFPHDKDRLIALAKKELSKYRRRNPGAGWPEFFINRVQVFFEFAFLKELNPEIPTLTNYDGDRIELWTAVYTFSNHGEIKKLLDNCRDLEPAEKDVYLWGREAGGTGPVPAGQEQRIILGRIFLEKDRLVLEVNSRRRLENGKKLLEDLCGGAITHRIDSMQDSRQLMRRGLETQKNKPVNENRRDVNEISPEEHEFVLGLMQEYYRNWVDQPVPALGGKTPRQAVKTRSGREKVRQLLKEFEFGQNYLSNKNASPLDLSEIWHELGLTRDT